MPTPLETYAQSEVNRLELLEATARSTFADAQALFVTRQSEYADAVEALSEAEAAVAAIRRTLGGSEVAADASSGGEALHDALVQLRSDRAAQIAAQLALLDAQALVDESGEQATELTRALGQAREALADAQARASKIATWTAALVAGSALLELPTTAAASETQTLLSDAKDKIDATLPLELRTRAIERLVATLTEDEAELTQQRALEDILDAGAAAVGGSAGAVAPLERIFERSEAAVDEYVNRAAAWLGEATTRLERVLARRTLTGAEAAALTTASVSDRADAVIAEHKYDTAVAQQAEAQRLLDRRVAEIYADFSLSDPEAAVTSDTDVNDQKTAINDAAATIAGFEDPAHADYASNTALRATLASWEADVPEFVWDDLLDWVLADRLITRLTAATPATLLSDLDTAEADLVAALEADAATDARFAPARSALAQALENLAQQRETAQQRRLAAVRGLR